jgi:hypothetical protein
MRIYELIRLLTHWLTLYMILGSLDRHIGYIFDPWRVRSSNANNPYMQSWVVMLRLPVQGDWQGLQNEAAPILKVK